MLAACHLLLFVVLPAGHGLFHNALATSACAERNADGASGPSGGPTDRAGGHSGSPLRDTHDCPLCQSLQRPFAVLTSDADLGLTGETPPRLVRVAAHVAAIRAALREAAPPRAPPSA
jgi:hypothetical protein